MNYKLVSRTIVDGGTTTVVNISASNMYQMFVNGVMVAQVYRLYGLTDMQNKKR